MFAGRAEKQEHTEYASSNGITVLSLLPNVVAGQTDDRRQQPWKKLVSACKPYVRRSIGHWLGGQTRTECCMQRTCYVHCLGSESRTCARKSVWVWKVQAEKLSGQRVPWLAADGYRICSAVFAIGGATMGALRCKQSTRCTD